MSIDLTIRVAEPADRRAIRDLVTAAFGQPAEADLVERLVADDDAVAELVALEGERVVGHVLFSRLLVKTANRFHPAVALAPLSVTPERQRAGIGGALVRAGHERLITGGETLSVVLGDPAYYGRFGYAHARAGGFESTYQCEALQALALGDEAPAAGALIYPPAFAAV